MTDRTFICVHTYFGIGSTVICEISLIRQRRVIINGSNKMAGDESQKHLAAAALKKQQGLSHMSQGQNDQALKEFKDALDLEIKALGDKHVTVAHTKINIASVYQVQGLHDAALQQYTEAQQILKESEASNGKALGVVYLNIGCCHLSRGEFDLARASYEEAVRVKKVDYGENHVEVLAFPLQATCFYNFC
jgi:tetratricopeptide (TPR) repeat protein